MSEHAMSTVDLIQFNRHALSNFLQLVKPQEEFIKLIKDTGSDFFNIIIILCSLNFDTMQNRSIMENNL